MSARAFPDAAADYQVADGEDFRVRINAKDFPARGEFRVYRVWGDVTKPARLKAAIGNLLAERGVAERRVRVSL